MKNCFQEFKSYVMITLGTLLLGAGVYFFKVPNGFATGGVSGIGIILGRLVPAISSGQWILMINVLLLILGMIILGKTTGVRTIYCSLLFSFMTYILEIVLPLEAPLSDQPILELVYAIGLTAIGSAIIFNYSASSGGTDIVALILKKYTSLDVGKALLVSDFVISASTFFVFGIKTGLFAMLGLFAKAFVVDAVIDLINSCKYFVVITEKRFENEINEYIIKILHHSFTKTEGKGGYTGEDKVILHTVCKRIEAIKLRKIIKQIDPHAFVIITTTSEIIGKGFRRV